MKALVILNPKAGKTSRKEASQAIRRMIRLQGCDCDIAVTTQPGDAEALVRDRAVGCNILVACGGDGTLSETINGLAALNAAPDIAYIPMGTTNDFAAGLGLTGNIREAVDDIFCGAREWLDIGCIDERRFAYVASFGSFAKSSYATPQALKNRIGRAAYFLECARELPTLRPYHMKITDDSGNIREGEYLFGAVSNAISIGGFLSYRHDDVDLSDGKHEVLLIRYPENIVQLSGIIRSVIAGDFTADGIELFRTSHICFECEEETEWSVDGERYAAGRKVEIGNVPRALCFAVPKRRAAAS